MNAMADIPFYTLRGMIDQYRDRFQEAFACELAAGELILGESVKKFEREFAEMLGVNEVIGVSNGLDALTLALHALEIGAGDEVILPTNSFIATALAVSSVGAKPVLVDCGLDHLIDPGHVTSAITDRTKAMIPVHLTGHPAEMNQLIDTAERYGLSIVEDAAQAHGASYHGSFCGTLGHLGCFSFYPTKNLGALGDGGAIACSDRRTAARVRRLANYGKQDRDTHVERGNNNRLDSIQAAFLRVTLPDLPYQNCKRAELAARYLRELSDCPGLSTPIVQAGCEPVWHLFIVRHSKRDALRQALMVDGINTLIHYRIPIHLQPAYSGLGHGPGDFPTAEMLADTMVSLPFHPWLSEGEVCRITGSVRRFCEREARDE